MAQSIKGITVEIGGNTTGLGKALEGVNKQSRNLQSELRTVDNLLKLDPGNLTLVKQKQDILTDSISATSDKLKTLKASQSQVEEQFKKGKIGRDQYIAFQKELTNTERKLKDLEKQKDSVNKISAAFATGKEKVKEFGKNIKDKIIPEPVKKVGDAFDSAKKKIKDVGETLSPVKEKLEGVASAAKKVGSATAKISAAGIKTVGASVNAAAQGFKAYALSATGAAAALGIAAIKSYGELEQNLGGSEAVFGEYAKSIQKTGEDAYKNLGVSQSDYLATANKMGALFQGTGLEQQKSLELTEKAMQRAGDMASVMGIDMQTALDSVAGAAKGNFTMMDNLGVAMNATNIEAYALSKGMNFKWNTATEAEKAEVAMQMFFENTEQYAGNFAKESTQTISGSFGMLKASVGSLVAGLGNSEADIENLVQNVIDAFSSVVENVSPIVESVAKAFPKVINAIVKEASKMLPKIITSITTELPKAMGTFIEGFNGLILGVVGAINSSLPMIITTILPTLITGFTGLVLGLVGMVPTLLPTLVDGALVLFLGLLDGLNLVIAQLMPMLPQLITDIVDTLIVNLPAIIEGGFTLIIGLITGITDCIPTLVDKVIELIPVITTALTDNIPKLIEAGLQLIVALATGLPKAIPEIIRALPEIINCIIDTLMEQDWLQIGVDILKGIADGLIEGVKAIGDSIASVASNVVGGFKKAFGIASPSKLFKKEIGPYLAQGIGVGFEDEMVGITKDMQEAIPRSFETDINANYSGASRNNSTGMAGNSNMTNTINIFANVSNDYDIKRMIGRISTELESLKMKEFAAVGG